MSGAYKAGNWFSWHILLITQRLSALELVSAQILWIQPVCCSAIPKTTFMFVPHVSSVHRDLKGSSLIKRNNRVPPLTGFVFIGPCLFQHKPPQVTFHSSDLISGPFTLLTIQRLSRQSSTWCGTAKWNTEISTCGKPPARINNADAEWLG